ncbi:MAG: two-component system response regulator [Legionellales bacterium]|nr:two-component system response regulator [Legionellales bacterium]
MDLIILDIRMPGEDGFTVCQKIRKTSDIPIIMLTANGEDMDRIIGLEMGADDYLPKPFNPRELVARIKAVLRRTAETKNSHKEEMHIDTEIYTFVNWKLDTATRVLMSPDDLEISITAGEYTLLMTFLERPKRVLSRDQLLEITHNRQAGPFDRSIDIQVSRLRQKIEDDPKNPKLITTVRGGGYMFTAPVKKRVQHG